jgi:hypothetical protein
MSPSIATRILLIAGCCCSLTSLSPRAQAYALEGKSWPNGTIVSMQLEMGLPTKPLQDGSTTWDQAVAPALDDWNAAMRDVQFATVMNSSAPISSGDGLNSASFASTIFGDAFGKNVLAVTYYLTQGGRFKEADVLFNKAETFDSYRGNLQFDSQGQCICDIRRVFLHELGHALGLAHPDDHGQHVDAVMNSVVSNRNSLSNDDLDGIHSLYGAPSVGGTPTPSPTATPAPVPSRLVNISTRMDVGVADDVLIGGFIIQGSALKKVILRAIGPSLANSGITGYLEDPTLELHDPSGALLQSNDNWQESLDSGDIILSGLAPDDARESAIVARLAPGSYTFILSGAHNTTGVGLVESYTLDTNGSRAANISTRGRVGMGENALIGGFIIDGESSKKMLVRALGPSLGTSGASAVLADPLVELYDAEGQLITSNDNWNSSPQANEIAATGIPPSDDREAAILITAQPGIYTAVVRGANDGEGLALVEIYDLDP